jgi:hypothetical protein
MHLPISDGCADLGADRLPITDGGAITHHSLPDSGQVLSKVIKWQT